MRLLEQIKNLVNEASVMNRQCVGGDEIVTKVDSTFENLDQQRTQGLEQLQQVQTVQTSALQRERQRLTAKYGEDHPRVQKINTRLTYNQGAQKDLTQEIKRSKISVSQFDPKTWKGHGLILDQNEIGVQGLTVSLSDANGNWIQALGYACTNEDGYFSIIYPKETDSGTTASTATKPNTTTPDATAPNVPDGQPLSLTVTNANRQQLHRERTARTFKIGQIEYWRIVLGEGDRPTCEPPPTDNQPAIAVQITAIDTPTQLTVNQPANFTATVNPDATLPIAADWDFGDGTTAKGLATTHSYTKPGDYSVTVTVSNPGGGDSRTTRVTVQEAPQTAVQVVNVDAPEQLLVNQVGRFSAKVNDDATPPVRSIWEFGDDSTGESLTATHAYTKPGTYTATITASNPGGKDSRTTKVTVREADPKPVQVLSIKAPDALTVNQSGDFGVKLNDDATPPVTCRWDFGDGDTTDTPKATHAYTKSGTYTVTCTVSNPGGSDTRTVQVRVQDPSVAVQIVNMEAPDPLTVNQAGNFSAKVNDDATPPITSEWNFDDGTTAKGLTADHAFTKSGFYSVTITASNPAGKDAQTKRVRVIEAPNPPQLGDIKANPANPTLQTPVRFTAEVQGDPPLTYQWDFGDNTPSSPDVTPSPHVYARPGNYTVMLKVSNAAGSDGRSLQVIVTARPRRRV